MSRPKAELLEAAWSLVDRAGLIVVVMHHNPDGDALGSAIALTEGLRSRGNKAHLISPQVMPEMYDYLSPEDIVEPGSPAETLDLVILTDCDRPDRTGDLQNLVESARESLVLDHHPPTSEFGTVRVTEQDHAATAEVVYYFLKHREVSFSRRIAEALLTGIVTDTGGFRYPNTRPATLEIAAELTRFGITTSEIAERVYDTRSLAGLKLMSRALSSLQVSPSGTVAWAKLSQNDYTETGAKPEETEGFVNLIHGLKGADVAAILREERQGHIRVSLRSRGDTPVNKAAEALGGGGHELAAACVLESTLPDAETKVLEELKKWTEF